MPLYAVIGIDHPPHSMELREKFRAEHRAFSQSMPDETKLAGAMYDDDGNQCGTLKIFEADSAEQVRQWYRDNDPFFNNNVYQDFYVIEWKMAFNQLEKRGWSANYPGKLQR